VVNITGSNSVNVFLGLGAPWTIAALYWKFHGRDAEWEALYPDVASEISGAAFVVETKNLGFSVFTFCIVCCLALALLHFRRKWVGAELGGSLVAKLNTAVCFVFMWCGWVAVVSWRVLRYREDWGMEPYYVQGGSFLALVVGVAASSIHMKVTQRKLAREASVSVSVSANDTTHTNV